MTHSINEPFNQQTIILLAAQAPKDKADLNAFMKNIEQLAQTFNLFQLGQKVMILGDPSFIPEPILKDSSWLRVYNSAYEQPMLTSIQRGISLLNPQIESAMIWPISEAIQDQEDIYSKLCFQKKHLHECIQSKDDDFPMCLPKGTFSHLLTLDTNSGLKTEFSTDLTFNQN